MPPLPQTPQRQKQVEHPTPNVEDFYFYETVSNQQVNKGGGDGHPPYGTAHPNSTKYPNFVLSHIAPAINDPEGKFSRYFYVKKYEDQFKHNYAFRGVGIERGNDLLTRTFLLPRGDFTDWPWFTGADDGLFTSRPEAGDSDPYANLADADNPFNGYVFAKFDEADAPEPLKGYFVVVIYYYVRICPLEGIAFDDKSNAPFKFTERIVPAEDYDVDEIIAGTHPDAGDFVMGSDGVIQELLPINCQWSLLRTRKEVDLTETYTFYDTVSFHWPAVLEYINFYPVNTKSGDLYKVLDRHRLKTSYNGPTVAMYEVSFSLEPPSKATLDAWLHPPMLPDSIIYDGVLLSFQIRSCLHGNVEVIDNVGTNHPVENGAYGITIPRTNYMEWPASINASYSVAREKSYYRITKMTLYKPDIDTLIPPTPPRP